MEHQTVTLEPLKSMARQQGLLRRGTRWYSNIKVPLDLQEALGKTHVRESLGTSDYREAARRIAYEKARWVALFDTERKKLRVNTPRSAPQKKRLLTAVTRQEAFQLSARYLATREHKFKEWMQTEGRHLPPHELDDIRSSISEDEGMLADGEEFRGNPLDGTVELQSFLDEEGYDCAVSSPAFQTMRPLMMEARLELLTRSQDIIDSKPVEERSNVFKGIHIHSPAIEEKNLGYTIDDLLRFRADTIKTLKRSEKTKDASKLTARLLREHFGGDKPVDDITRADMHQLFDLLRRIPPNATMRYKGMSLAQAVAAADKAGDMRRLSPKTLRNNYIQITALFNLAVSEKLMKENPSQSKITRLSFDNGEQEKPREQFTVSDLNKLFRSPPYVGKNPRTKCKGRDGHFWVPLLALFHGMRCNEACQLYTEDVKTRDGITFVAIREEREDGSKCDKRLKTKQSKREVPLHPELVKLGFMEFVSERQQDSKHPRLFPEIPAGKKGYFSDYFSKWFARTARSALGKGFKATMHSFRHQFRDATRAARLPDETVASLAGWEYGEGPGSRQMSHYGRGPEYFRILAEDIAKVQYPELSMSHLYPQKTP